MPDLKYIYVGTGRPSRRLPGGSIEEGMYCVIDDTVVLYDRSGKTILAKSKSFSHLTPARPRWEC
jgi:hypothetical protein